MNAQQNKSVNQCPHPSIWSMFTIPSNNTANYLNPQVQSMTNVYMLIIQFILSRKLALQRVSCCVSWSEPSFFFSFSIWVSVSVSQDSKLSTCCPSDFCSAVTASWMKSRSTVSDAFVYYICVLPSVIYLFLLPYKSLCGLVDFAECPQKEPWQPRILEPSSAHPFPGPIGVEEEHFSVGASAVAQPPPPLCWSQAPCRAVRGPESARQIRKRKQKFSWFLIKTLILKPADRFVSHGKQMPI